MTQLARAHGVHHRFVRVQEAERDPTGVRYGGENLFHDGYESLKRTLDLPSLDLEAEGCRPGLT